MSSASKLPTKDTMIATRVTPARAALYREIAFERGQRLSEFVRQALDAAIRQPPEAAS